MFNIYFKYINEIYNKKITLIINKIDGNLIKIYFFKWFISTKITQNLTTKSIF